MQHHFRMVISLHFILHLCAFATIASGQTEFDFTAERLINLDANLFNFSCDDVNGPVSRPMFFRNNVQITFPSPPTRSHALYRITRTEEGSFACGTQGEFGMTTSIPPQILIGK